jgi:DNA-binding response OmpR family regulator
MTYKVLIVDDSKLARMAVIKALSTLQPGWTRFEAANADQALEFIGSDEIDVCLLDFNMPGRDGLALATEIRALRPDMPIAIISANYQTEIVNQTREIGAAFLAKPLTEDALRGFLEAATARLEKPAT